MNQYTTRRNVIIAAALAAGGLIDIGLNRSAVSAGAKFHNMNSYFPKELLEPYSPDAPPGPSFDSAERTRQWRAGADIHRSLLKAFHAGVGSFTIPPGDYRFSSPYVADKNSFLLDGLKRPPSQPFHIIAKGVTFWFEMARRLPYYHLMVRFQNCCNVSIDGLTVDSAVRGAMEARITEIDNTNNALIIQPLDGTRLISQARHSQDNNDFRFVPYKADGRNMPALYQTGYGWGPGNDLFTGLHRLPNGSYRLQMKTRKLLATTLDPQWKKTYGPDGTLETGDLVAVLYSVAAAFHIHNCEHITLSNCRSYAAKSFVSESGGYGKHHYVNCRFISRPGTNNLLGGEGVAMSNGLMHGSVMDGVVTGRTTDDPYNNHAHWKLASACTGRSITFHESLPPQLQSGDLMELYDSRKHILMATVKVKSVAGKSVEFDGEIPATPASDIAALFPAFSNQGWVIRNCYFINCYQRILIQCGKGLFENNFIHRMGDCLVLQTCFPGGIEGGNPSDITIRNNVFYDSGISPDISTIALIGYMRPLRNVRIENNVIYRSGRYGIMADGFANLAIRNNMLVDACVGNQVLPVKSVSGLRLDWGATPPEVHALAMTGPRAIRLQNGDRATVESNVLIGPVQRLLEAGQSRHIIANRNFGRGDAGGEIVRRIRRWITRDHRSAQVILHHWRAE